MTIKRGCFVTFNDSYIDQKCRAYRASRNFEDIKTFFTSKHRVTRIVGGNIVVLRCPIELGIGITPGIFQPDIYSVTACVGEEEPQIPCKCQWAHCRNNKVDQKLQET
jgi:hypothetical protein